MVHINANIDAEQARRGHRPKPTVHNMIHQHAFVLVGDDQLFGVHMTQYHCEIHKYQIILKLSFAGSELTPDGDPMEQLRDLRRRFPEDDFILCNGSRLSAGTPEWMSIPDLGSGRVTQFIGNIYHGVPPVPDPAPEHYFPWNDDVCRPAIANVLVTIERVVTYRPFAHNLPKPEFATYLLWGHEIPEERRVEGGPWGEAHMTNLQTAEMISGPFDTPHYGWDYDHIMSLEAAPDWLEPTMLEAGIVVSVPLIRMEAEDSHEPAFGDGWPKPMDKGNAFEVLYRGVGSPLTVTAGTNWLWATVVCNGENMHTRPDILVAHWTAMPKKYLK